MFIKGARGIDKRHQSNIYLGRTDLSDHRDPIIWIGIPM